MPDTPPDFFYNDAIRAIDALTEAQRIAFAPLSFQAAKTLRDLGVLGALAEAGEVGLTMTSLQSYRGLSEYALQVLLSMGLSMGLVKLAAAGDGERFVLGKVGYALQFDPMTRVNFDFAADVCYRGAEAMTQAVCTGEPAGLRVFGAWPTIYAGLSQLPEAAQRSWFAFDHFYSDAAFGHALALVFAHKPVHVLDIGGNTAKWALACYGHDANVSVTIVDLPGQIVLAEHHIAQASAGDRIRTRAVDLLDPRAALPAGADTVWMSQFLDCFALPEVTSIARRVAAAISSEANVFVLEPLCDQQRFVGATYALHATSLYFTCMANGNSRMYGMAELVHALGEGGLQLVAATHNVGPRDYSLLLLRRAG